MRTLFLILLSGYCYGQNQLSGRVVDAVTQQGIVGVSVYVNNTTFGSKTDENGEFFFYCQIAGKAEVVASHINYDKISQAVNLSSNQKMNFSLKQKGTNLKEVVIKKAKRQNVDDKAKWFRLFSLNLIGKHAHGSTLTTVTNPEVLIYEYDAATKELTVMASGPLAVDNAKLGYKINLDLEKFTFNFLTNEVAYKYTSMYEETTSSNFLAKTLIKKNRNTAYYGSSMHFMRALYANQLIEEGFHTEKYRTIANLEKKRVASIILEAMAEQYEKAAKPDLLLTKLFPKDTAAHYSLVMKQPDAKNITLTTVSASDLTAKNRRDRTVNFNFTDTLRVVYDGNLSDKTQEPPLKPKPKISPKPENSHAYPLLTTYLYFFDTGGVNIENTGYYPDFKLFMYGDMAERRLSSALPYDFEPTKISSK